MAELINTLMQIKNRSTKSCRSEATGENSQDSKVCPKCGGAEWIFSRDEKGVERAEPCTCREKAVMSRRLRFAEIPDVFKSLELKTFRIGIYQDAGSRRTISDACKIVKEYLDDFENQKAAGMGLYIWSRTKGSGKTRIAAGIANELLKKYTVKFSVSMTIIQEIRNSWRKDAQYSENSLLDALCTVEILVIDDLRGIRCKLD